MASTSAGRWRYWVDTVCDRFLELDIDTPVRSNFRACLDQIDFGPATLSFVGAASQRIRRTPARISRTRYPTFFLLQFRVGHGLLRQRGKELQAHAGECVLIDGTEPYDLDCPQATSAAILRMPEDWLRRWLPNPENSCRRRCSRRATGVRPCAPPWPACAWKPAAIWRCPAVPWPSRSPRC